jgi:L-threonylcarbamoyladenylate synthase
LSTVPTDSPVDSVDPVGRAVRVLRNGGLVGLPTETVYGLGADASNETAVRRVFAAKGRPADHPLIVHLHSVDVMSEWAVDVPPSATLLATSCWPGPLTVLVQRAADVLDVVTGGRESVGLRVPAHPLALDLLRRFGGGVAAPSANRFGHVSPTTAAHVRADLGDTVDYVLDGGASHIGVESTIVDCTVSPPQILRPGGIPDEQIEQLLAPLNGVAPMDGPSRASGMLTSHYAPSARVEVFETLGQATERAAHLAKEGHRVDVLDTNLDVVAAAQQLYAWLRAADDRSLDVLVAVLPPPIGLGHAVRDRLRKAAATR